MGVVQREDKGAQEKHCHVNGDLAFGLLFHSNQINKYKDQQQPFDFRNRTCEPSQVVLVRQADIVGIQHDALWFRIGGGTRCHWRGQEWRLCHRQGNNAFSSLFPDDLAAYRTSIMRLTKRNIPSGVFVVVKRAWRASGRGQKPRKFDKDLCHIVVDDSEYTLSVSN